MALLGKTKFQKFANITVFIIFVIWGLNKSGILSVEPAIEFVHKYEISASELKAHNVEDLNDRLNSYQIDEGKLSEILASTGVSLQEFYGSVSTNIVFKDSQYINSDITIEFVSNNNNKALKPAFDYIGGAIKQSLAASKGLTSQASGTP